jgi:hypothetical protein
MADNFFTSTAEIYVFKSIVRPTGRARGRVDSHRQLGVVRDFGFFHFVSESTSLQPPVTQTVRRFR